MLEQQATRINDIISQRQAKSQQVSLDMYEQLAENTYAQIDNLVAQNEALEEQQNTVGITNTKFLELQATIESNNSAIAGMVTNLDGYNKQVTRFASNYAKSLMDAVNSAISESSSDTGLSNEVMDALMGEFSNLMDVQDYDFSSLFYKTANGIKVNANELKKLIEIQKTAFSEKTKKNITDQNNLINEQAKYYVKDGDAVKVLTAQTLRDHDRKMDALRSELAQYNEIMESIEKSTDLYAQWQ